MEQSEAFVREACALPEIASAVWGGFVFANLSGTAPPLAPALAPLEERLARYDVASLVTAGVIELDSPWNWKVMVENFMESYHHIGPHAQTLQRTHPGLGTHAGVADDLFAVLENPAVDAEHAPFVVAAIFPLTLLYFSDGPLRLGLWYELTDIEAARFTLRVHMLTPPEFAAQPDYVAVFREQVSAVHQEDIAICERTQAGVTSPLYAPGPLSHLEGCLWRFHLHLKRAFAEAA
jgi:phenylpropionate dioxygenase-like ring-hydroxylating dioxygenase large terminal subunit